MLWLTCMNTDSPSERGKTRCTEQTQHRIALDFLMWPGYTVRYLYLCFSVWQMSPAGSFPVRWSEFWRSCAGPTSTSALLGFPWLCPSEWRSKTCTQTVHYLCLVGRRKKPLLAPTCCRDAGEMQVKGWSHCRGGCFVLVLEVRGLLPSTRCKLLCGQKSSCPPPLAKELAGRYTLVVCSSALNTLWFRYTVQVQCTCTVYRYGAHCAVYSVQVQCSVECLAELWLLYVVIHCHTAPSYCLSLQYLYITAAVWRYGYGVYRRCVQWMVLTANF